MRQKSDAVLDSWVKREALAEEMIPLIGRLYRDNNVVTSVYGRTLINQSVVGLLKAHRFARQIDDVELPLEETLPLLRALVELKLGAASVDLARLSLRYKQSGGGQPLVEFLRQELGGAVGRQGAEARTTTDVVLYGFGRIGRLLARILIENAASGNGLRLRAIVVRAGLIRTSSSAPPCCAATRSTARSRARSPSTRTATRSSPTAP